MGWADLLGPDNGFQQFVAGNRGKLGQFGAGLASGQNFSSGLAAAAQGIPAGQATDDAYATAQKAEAERQQQLNQTIEFMRAKGYDDLVQRAQTGGMKEAWDEALKRSAPGYDQANAPKPIEVGGVLLDPTTYQPIFDSRKPDTPSIPSGYQQAPNGAGLTYIPGGPADPAVRVSDKPPTEAELRAAGLSTVVSGDAALLLGDGTKPGIYDQLANGGDQAWNAGAFGINPLSFMSSPEYRQAKDAVASIAQSYLYSTSGASAPEGEIARVAESVTPKPLDSPQQLADKKRRLEAMVTSIQQKRGNAATSGQRPAGQTSTGLQWSIEP